MFAFDARQAAEAQAYVAYHFYAMSVEAAARADIGESHTGILLATTAMGAIETIQGSEYGLETRALCLEALERSGSPQVAEMRKRAHKYAMELYVSIRDPELKHMFVKRGAVAKLFGSELPVAPEIVAAVAKAEPPPLPSDFPPSSEPPPAAPREDVQSDEDLG
jgi:hypothetical protein